MFTKFYRVQDEKMAPQPGTGLGLYNVQRIVRLHKGTIRASSRYGRDFTVRFTLPRPDAAPAAAAQASRRSRGAAARARVKVVRRRVGVSRG